MKCLIIIFHANELAVNSETPQKSLEMQFQWKIMNTVEFILSAFYIIMMYIWA